jgi:hypothetical protein
MEYLLGGLIALGEVTTTARLQDLIAIADMVAARVSAAVERVDRSGEVAADGAVSTAHWLRANAGRSAGDARGLVDRSRRLRMCPALAAAWTDGRLSSGQIDIVVAAVTDRTEAMLAEQESVLVSSLVGLSVGDTHKAMRHWAAHAGALVDGPAPVDHAAPCIWPPGSTEAVNSPDASTRPGSRS